MPAPKAALRDIHELRLDPTKPHKVSHVTGHLVDADAAAKIVVKPPVVVPAAHVVVPVAPPISVVVEPIVTAVQADEKEYVGEVLDDKGELVAEVDVKIETASDGTQTEDVTVIASSKKSRGKKPVTPAS